MTTPRSYHERSLLDHPELEKPPLPPRPAFKLDTGASANAIKTLAWLGGAWLLFVVVTGSRRRL